MPSPVDPHLVATSLNWFQFSWTGDYTTVDLIAAGTNALNGALLARRPDHYRNWTVVGILLMAFLGGLGGGVTRDVMLAQVPSALTNSAYIVVCLGCGILGYLLAYKGGQLFREGLFQFMTSFSLPWYAIVGCMAAVEHDLPVLAILVFAVVGPTAGRFYIDIASGVPPKQFIRGEWFVSCAVLVGAVWILCTEAGLTGWWAIGIAFVVGYTFRVLALWFAWEEPLAREPAGVYLHSDGRPLLGRKLKGKSRRELHDLGLLVEEPARNETERADGTDMQSVSARGGSGR